MRAASVGRFGTAVAVFYVFLWASAFVPSKIASTQTDPLWFLAVRFGSAGLVLGGLALALRRPFPRTRTQWLVAAGVGILANACYLGLTYEALRHLSSGMGAIVASTNPLVLALVAPQLLGERLTWWKGVGLALGFGGVIAIVAEHAGSGTARPQDVILAFAGVCATIASSVLFKRLGSRQDLLALNAVGLVVAGLAMVPAALLTAGTVHVTPTPELAAAFAYLVLVMSVGASLLWFWLLGRGEVSRVTAFYFLTPAFGLALSALLLHERVDAGDVAGLVAIAAGIAIVQRA